MQIGWARLTFMELVLKMYKIMSPSLFLNDSFNWQSEEVNILVFPGVLDQGYIEVIQWSDEVDIGDHFVGIINYTKQVNDGLLD